MWFILCVHAWFSLVVAKAFRLMLGSIVLCVVMCFSCSHTLLGFFGFTFDLTLIGAFAIIINV